MTPEQIEAALKARPDLHMPFGYHGKWSQRHDEAIQFALHLALRVMDEPSEEMVATGVDQYTGGKTFTQYAKAQFKAMRDRLIEEVWDDR